VCGVVKTLMLACSRYWVGLDLGVRLGFGYLEQSFKNLLKPNLDFDSELACC
jgi:hypothetical protein